MLYALLVHSTYFVVVSAVTALALKILLSPGKRITFSLLAIP
jgi:hypothetical protein